MPAPRTPFRTRLVTLLGISVLAAIASPVGASQGMVPCLPRDAPATATPDAAGSTETWAQHSPMPRPRAELGAAAIDGTVYAVGGFGDEAFLDCYHVGTDTWATGADLPVGVHHPGVTALDGMIYVAGGYDPHVATDAVWAYDPARDTWQARAPLPAPRGALGLVAMDGRLYAVGGAQDHLGGPVTGAVDVYDPSTDTWEPLSALPTPREHLAVVAYDGWLYAVGGRVDTDESDPLASAAERYDPVSDRWETLAPLPTPRGGFGGASAGGQVVVAGGERGTSSFDTAEAYDPGSDSWSALPPMPTARHGVAIVAIGDTVYAIGGSTVARAAVLTGALESLRIGDPFGG